MKILAPVLLLVLAFGSCAQKKSDVALTENYVLAPAAFDQKIKGTENAVVLDVRTAEEFQSGMLPNAVNIDFNNPEFKRIIEKQDKQKPYFVYCAKGGRSAKAASLMRNLGFGKVYELEGGIIAWQDAGLSTVKP